MTDQMKPIKIYIQRRYNAFCKTSYPLCRLGQDFEA